jgi:hypothetical protein
VANDCSRHFWVPLPTILSPLRGAQVIVSAATHSLIFHAPVGNNCEFSVNTGGRGESIDDQTLLVA